ncbi:MAG: sirohydrochlorin cobaltochelatase [Deltaproteobacteria bacterium]|jgi:cobalamin biosynthesis Co2+ chelatase CbiK|nr:sirohydrochlorin cobaltochelatase [Deltaproteobacteria bacterium]
MPVSIAIAAAAFAAAAVFVSRRATASVLPPPAVILVSRGVADLEDLEDVSVVLARLKEAFPCYQERLAFSSDRIRSRWRKRGHDPAFMEAHPDLDPRFYSVGNVISSLAAVQETGPRLTLVQGLQLVDGPEFYDLSSLVESLRQIKTFDRSSAPFPWIGLGEPALGKGDGQKESLHRAAVALAPLFDEALRLNAGVLLAADPSGGVNTPAYRALEDVLKTVYRSPLALALRVSRQGHREGVDILEAEVPPPGPILLATLAPVSDEAVRADLDGPQEDSWGSILKARGFKVEVRPRGLGSNRLFADLIVENVKRQEEALSHRYMMD